MTDAFGDLLALVDFGDFLLEQLITALAKLDDLGALGAPSWETWNQWGRSRAVGKSTNASSLRT